MESTELQESRKLLHGNHKKSLPFTDVVYITTDGENAQPEKYARNSGRGANTCVIGFTTAVLLLTCLVATTVIKAKSPHIGKDRMGGSEEYLASGIRLSQDASGQGVGGNVIRPIGGLLTVNIDEGNLEGVDSDKTQKHECSPNFLLYTAPSQYLPMIAANIPSEFDPHLKTVFLVHGFQSSSNNSWIKSLAAALKSKESVNAIVVDWRKEAGPFFYPLTKLDSYHSYMQAVNNTIVCAQQLAGFFNILLEKGLSREDGHCIGHSLGAQLCGLAGKHSTWGRISGLDPAGPYYHDLSCSERLCSSDALYVDVIHTDGTAYGLMEQSGHVDFYPNGGMSQPGCDEGTNNTDHACNHSRSCAYYIASVTASGEPCFSTYKTCTQGSELQLNCTLCQGTCQEMGYHSINYRDSPGTYYLNTTGDAPYCI